MPQVHIDRILLATDFSAGSMAALPYAVALARRFHSKLYLAHVVPSEAYCLVPMSDRDSVLESVKAHANAQMAGLRAMTVLGGIAHEVLIDHGDVWPTLSAMAEKEAIDLLVIGTHGRRGVEKLLLGSTAEEILRLAQRPVLMVGPLCSVAPETELSLRRILHATDFSPEAEPAMHYAYSLAKAYGATLALLHVAEDVWQEPLSTRLRPVDFFRERLLERHWVVEQEGVVPEYYVEFGPRADCILEISDKLRTELIVIGVRGARYPHVAAHLPGPTAYDVVTRARCPVLVLRGAQVKS
jgi:nucleotide-binding universal stress UspA family protein